MTTSPLAGAILISWRRNGAYALRLVGDLTHAQMTAQPVPGVTMNHPAWVLSHLNVYAPIARALCEAAPFDDPADHPFGVKSTVVNDPGAYPDRRALIEEYRVLHDAAQAALERTDEAALAATNPLARWREMHPTVGDMLVTLMVKHESTHLGQLSAWRRAMGLPPVQV
ncbi:MAG: DinB family protein [Phycisphaerales bacterium]|nr:MAG: DinB family protein [Phycisphaerales bacterium]